MRQFYIFLLFAIAWLPVQAEPVIMQPGEAIQCVLQEMPDVLPVSPGSECQHISQRNIDPQNRLIWVQMVIDVPPEVCESNDAPAGFYISGKASSRVWLNGVFLADNGLPSATPSGERPGLMDFVAYIPDSRCQTGLNQIDMIMSAQRSLIELRWPMSHVGIHSYINPHLAGAMSFWPSMIPFGVFIAGALYFLAHSFQGHLRVQSLLLTALASMAALQLVAEGTRRFIPYTYEFHDVRLTLILLTSMSFGLLLTGFVLVRLQIRHWGRVFGLTLATSIATVSVAQSFDTKTALALILPIAFSLCLSLYRLVRAPSHKRSPLVFLVLILAGTIGLAILQPSSFIDTYHYYAVALLLLALFWQQALLINQERFLRQEAQRQSRALEISLERAQFADRQTRIELRNAGSTEYVDATQIAFCKGAGDYVELHLISGKEKLSNDKLSTLEDLLPRTFLRVHRSYLVNGDLVQRLEREPNGNGIVQLTNGARIPVSRRILPGLRTALSE